MSSDLVLVPIDLLNWLALTAAYIALPSKTAVSILQRVDCVLEEFYYRYLIHLVHASTHQLVHTTRTTADTILMEFMSDSHSGYVAYSPFF